ncbi:MAG: hypothetical protein AB7P49_16905 [Bdellovibrionales bacterium]
MFIFRTHRNTRVFLSGLAIGVLMVSMGAINSAPTAHAADEGDPQQVAIFHSIIKREDFYTVVRNQDPIFRSFTHTFEEVVIEPDLEPGLGADLGTFEAYLIDKRQWLLLQVGDQVIRVKVRGIKPIDMESLRARTIFLPEPRAVGVVVSSPKSGMHAAVLLVGGQVLNFHLDLNIFWPHENDITKFMKDLLIEGRETFRASSDVEVLMWDRKTFVSSFELSKQRAEASENDESQSGEDYLDDLEPVEVQETGTPWNVLVATLKEGRVAILPDEDGDEETSTNADDGEDQGKRLQRPKSHLFLVSRPSLDADGKPEMPEVTIDKSLGVVKVKYPSREKPERFYLDQILEDPCKWMILPYPAPSK